ncbi:MAG: PAS domain-containing protein [Nitrospina sp.]|jgi:two-component system, NtrC family, nitrogen regulation sensor histidine kinase NtrY|nr:PAS domain-containing protein [Nitrospina sp.]
MPSDPLINKPSIYIPPTEEQLRDKRKRATFTILGVFVALIGMTFLENHFLQAQSASTFGNNITVLAVFNIILILLFLLIILITRNLVKVYNERKSKIIGSKFQTKLIIAFLILALVPSILLFTVASKLFTFSIGNWFNLQIEQTLQYSMDIARDYYSGLEKRALLKTKNIERFINNQELYLKLNRDQLKTLARDKVVEYDLTGILIYDNDLQPIVSEIDSSKLSSQARLNYSELIQKSIGGEGVTEIKMTHGENLMIVVVPLTETIEGKISIWGYILTLNPVFKSSLKKIETIRNTFEDYQQQSFLKLPVSANYYTTFLLITLLVLFSAIWLGFYMARGITVPIQQLAEGVRRITEGDLDFKIGARATDEIAILVDSFNTMTRQLNEGRINIQHAHEDLKRTNIELDRRRNYIETILDNIGAGVVSVDKRGTITTFNKAAEKILHLKSENIFGSSYHDAFDFSYYQEIRKLSKSMNAQNKESIEKQIDIRVGETNLTLLVNVQILRGATGKYRGLVIVFEDLTHLMKTQKIAAWKEVAQGIAHEIKNPLTPIQLNTQRLKKKYYENREDFDRVFDESIHIITQEVEGMKELLNEFLRFSRMPTPNPRPTSLHKIIDEILISYSEHDKNLKIKKSFDPNLSSIHIDPEQIRRVFINLFENATDALDDGGSIQISTRVLQKEKLVRIEFSDNGAGISPADRDKLFLPHFTTKKRGTGLGLAIVNRIIVDHNGSIQVKDNHPKGTIFVIDLPYSPTVLEGGNPSARKLHPITSA